MKKRNILTLCGFILLMTFVISGCTQDNKNIDNLVSDAYTYEHEGITYKIPQINLESEEIKQLNKEIYDEYYKLIDTHIMQPVKDGLDLTRNKITYEWAVNDDILSLWLIDCTPSNNNYYKVCNISLTEKEILSNEDVLDQLNYDKDEYLEKTRNGLGMIAWETCSKPFAHAYEKDIVLQTINDENIEKSDLFINNDGDLCVVGNVFSIAGANSYYHIVNLDKLEVPQEYLDMVQKDLTKKE